MAASVTAAEKARLSNLHPFHPGQSGNPGGRSKRIPELFEQMAADLGELTGIERAVLWQAARLMARSERSKDANDAVRLANAAARLLASLSRTKGQRGRPGYSAMLSADADRQQREDAERNEQRRAAFEQRQREQRETAS